MNMHDPATALSCGVILATFQTHCWYDLKRETCEARIRGIIGSFGGCVIQSLLFWAMGMLRFTN